MKCRFDDALEIESGFLFDKTAHSFHRYLDPVSGEVIKLDTDIPYATTGYPGATLWHRAQLPGRDPVEVTPPKQFDARLSLDKEGFLVIVMKDGRVIDHGKTRRFVHIAKDIEKFKGFMQDQINRMNGDVKALLDVHSQAISPDSPKVIYPEIFYAPYPRVTTPGRLWFLSIALLVAVALLFMPKAHNQLGAALLFGLAAAVIVAFRFSARARAQREIKIWKKRKAEFEEVQGKILEMWKNVCFTGDDKNKLLSMALNSFDWPRKTNVNFELSPDCSELHLDMDLPGWQELPHHTWKVGADNVTLERVMLDEDVRKKRYLRHVHSLVFLAASCSFWALPGLSKLIVSGFKETPSSKEGGPEFLISAVIARSAWQEQDFSSADKIDPVDALEKFELAKKVDAGAVEFLPITPF